MVRRTATVMAMLGFALACLLGALGGCSVETALGRALLAMGAFFLLGLGLGRAGELLLREHFRALAAQDDEETNAASSGERPGGTAANE